MGSVHALSGIPVTRTASSGSAVAAFVVALLLVSGGCGTDATNQQPEVLGDPVLCLEDAGLANVEQRSSTLWRGQHELGYLVFVNEHDSTREARELVDDAIDSYRAQAGTYSVIGPATIAAGALFEDDEGLEANRIVQRVATCMDTAP